ncbi:MAG TPA: CPBP family intramembrane metalloprotease, partial [Methanoregulaceae archaeon]|nr:CPBP family intramembrane metalloprotease [Methanoregulaceae archaeon]
MTGSATMVPTILFLLLFNCFAAAGEELGWRGLLVPELNQFLGFMELALLSGAVRGSWRDLIASTISISVA